MTEKGFFHPARGYWQAIADPSDAILATYPEGTVEVPLKPGANFDWDGSTWVTIPEPAPTKAEQEAARAEAYRTEGDPIYFKWQAGEATEEEWLAKRQEIRDCYPYPEA